MGKWVDDRHTWMVERWAGRMVAASSHPANRLWYAGAEIAGCFAFRVCFRLEQLAWWLLLGMASLIVFAWCRILVDADAAGSACAAYGGIYIAV